MRLLVGLLLFCSTASFAQTENDSNAIAVPEWQTPNYSQEDKIYNRTVWTFVDNPALAGFDRKLSVAYRFRMKNLSMGVPNKDGNLELAFMKHEAFLDLALGGPKQNWGAGIYYSQEKELQHTYQRIQSVRSLRIRLIKEHYLLLGVAVGVQFAKLNNYGRLTFGDMIDSRTGFVYQTNEIKPPTNRIIGYANAGLRYYWKRLSFDYVFEYDPQGTWALRGMPTSAVRNKLKAVYHIKVDDDITVSPELVTDITTTYARFGQIGSDKVTLKATNNFVLFSAFATITYKDMAFAQLGVVNLNSVSFRLGYQLKDLLVIQIGASSYFDRTMQKIGGMASADIGIRYQIRPWYR